MGEKGRERAGVRGNVREIERKRENLCRRERGEREEREERERRERA